MNAQVTTPDANSKPRIRYISTYVQDFYLLKLEWAKFAIITLTFEITEGHYIGKGTGQAINFNFEFECLLGLTVSVKDCRSRGLIPESDCC